jgi:plasmid stability protein
MALNLSIKNVPEALAEKLRRRAEENHRSLQGELMALIESSTREADAGPSNDAFSAKRVGEPLIKPTAAASEKLTLRDVAARMHNRFPAPVIMPAGMSAVEAVRQMRDERDGSQWRATDSGVTHHAKDD